MDNYRRQRAWHNYLQDFQELVPLIPNDRLSQVRDRRLDPVWFNRCEPHPHLNRMGGLWPEQDGRQFQYTMEFDRFMSDEPMSMRMRDRWGEGFGSFRHEAQNPRPQLNPGAFEFRPRQSLNPNAKAFVPRLYRY